MGTHLIGAAAVEFGIKLRYFWYMCYLRRVQVSGPTKSSFSRRPHLDLDHLVHHSLQLGFDRSSALATGLGRTGKRRAWFVQCRTLLDNCLTSAPHAVTEMAPHVNIVRKLT